MGACSDGLHTCLPSHAQACATAAAAASAPPVCFCPSLVISISASAPSSNGRQLHAAAATQLLTLAAGWCRSCCTPRSPAGPPLRCMRRCRGWTRGWRGDGCRQPRSASCGGSSSQSGCMSQVRRGALGREGSNSRAGGRRRWSAVPRWVLQAALKPWIVDHQMAAVVTLRCRMPCDPPPSLVSTRTSWWRQAVRLDLRPHELLPSRPSAPRLCLAWLQCPTREPSCTCSCRRSSRRWRGAACRAGR